MDINADISVGITNGDQIFGVGLQEHTQKLAIIICIVAKWMDEKGARREQKSI